VVPAKLTLCVLATLLSNCSVLPTPMLSLPVPPVFIAAPEPALRYIQLH
jgi:hypothetical protein